MEKDKLYLIFVNKVGDDWKGNHTYEFLFSDSLDDIDGEDWDNYPAAGHPLPPDSSLVNETAVLSSELQFELLQNNTAFSMWDAIDGVVAIAWEDLTGYPTYPDKRISFRFGDTLDKVEKTVYARDIRLEIKGKNELKE